MTSRRPSGICVAAAIAGCRRSMAALVARDQALLDQVAQDLLHEERVALGLAVDASASCQRHILAGDVRHHALHLVDA